MLQKSRSLLLDKFEGVFIQIGEDDPEEDKLVQINVKDGVLAWLMLFWYEGEQNGCEEWVPKSIRTAAPARCAKAGSS